MGRFKTTGGAALGFKMLGLAQKPTNACSGYKQTTVPFINPNTLIFFSKRLRDFNLLRFYFGMNSAVVVPQSDLAVENL